MKLIICIIFSLYACLVSASEQNVESTLLAFPAGEPVASKVNVIVNNAGTPKASLRFESTKSGVRLYIWNRDVPKFKEVLENVISDNSIISTLKVKIPFGTTDGLVLATTSSTSPDIKYFSIATPQGLFSFELAQLPEIVRLLDFLTEQTKEKIKPNKKH